MCQTRKKIAAVKDSPIREKKNRDVNGKKNKQINKFIADCRISNNHRKNSLVFIKSNGMKYFHLVLFFSSRLTKRKRNLRCWLKTKRQAKRKVAILDLSSCSNLFFSGIWHFVKGIYLFCTCLSEISHSKKTDVFTILTVIFCHRSCPNNLV